jgi:hypothetical protein
MAILIKVFKKKIAIADLYPVPQPVGYESTDPSENAVTPSVTQTKAVMTEPPQQGLSSKSRLKSDRDRHHQPQL